MGRRAASRETVPARGDELAVHLRYVLDDGIDPREHASSHHDSSIVGVKRSKRDAAVGGVGVVPGVHVSADQLLNGQGCQGATFPGSQEIVAPTLRSLVSAGNSLGGMARGRADRYY